jgi:hypothetical protein
VKPESSRRSLGGKAGPSDRGVGSYPIRVEPPAGRRSWSRQSKLQTAPCSHLGSKTRKLERVRCSSLVDWPVYPRLRRIMHGSERGRNSGRRALPFPTAQTITSVWQGIRTCLSPGGATSTESLVAGFDGPVVGGPTARALSSAHRNPLVTQTAVISWSTIIASARHPALVRDSPRSPRQRPALRCPAAPQACSRPCRCCAQGGRHRSARRWTATTSNRDSQRDAGAVRPFLSTTVSERWLASAFLSVELRVKPPAKP